MQQEPQWQDIENWPTVDIFVGMTQKKRKLFNRNWSLLSRALQGEPLHQLACEYGLSSSRVTQILQRALGGDEDTPPLLSRGLIPGNRLQPMKRFTPLSTHQKNHGARGSFSHLLEALPNLKVYLDKLIKGYVRRLRRGQNLTPRVFHQAFIRYLKNQKWPQDTYPFTEASLGYQSLRRYLNKQVIMLTLPKTSARVILPTQSSMRIGQEIQIDEHLVHVHGQVGIIFNDVIEPLRLSRISLLLARDVGSNCHLGFTLALTGSPNQDDILSLLEKIHSPWKPRELKTPGLSYLPNAGFPTGDDGASSRVTLGIVRLDNALIHKANTVRSLLLQYCGATINFGLVRTPKARNIIEQAFKQLNEGLHRFPSTSGSHSQDSKAEPRKHKAKAPIIPLSTLEEVIDVLLANENASSQGNLGGSSALEVWKYQLSNMMIPLRPKLFGNTFKPFHTRQVVTVRKPKRECRSPFINFQGARYNGNNLNNVDLINKEILIEYDRRDIRTLVAYTLDGQPLGLLVAPKAWQRFRHGLKTRKIINKLIKGERIKREDPLGGYFDYLLEHRYIPAEALKMIKLTREYEFNNQMYPIEKEPRKTKAFSSLDGIPEWSAEMVKNRNTL